MSKCLPLGLLSPCRGGLNNIRTLVNVLSRIPQHVAHKTVTCVTVKNYSRQYAIYHARPITWQCEPRSIVRGGLSFVGSRQFTTSRRLVQAQPGPPKDTNQTPAPKPILQQTTELKDQLKASVTKSVSHENIYNVPNILTFTRLIAAPVVGYLILHDQHFWAAALFAYAGITDLVDGWIARRWNLQTVVGSVIDPMADKLLMTILTVCLAIKGALPVWLATLILGRDVSLAIAAIYYRYASLPSPKSLARYWNFSLPSAEVHPTAISKYNTFLQLVLIGGITLVPVVGPAVDTFLSSASNGNVDVGNVMAAAQYIVAATTVWSGASYLYTKNAVKILGEKTSKEKMRILTNGRSIIAVCFLACFGIALGLEYR